MADKIKKESSGVVRRSTKERLDNFAHNTKENLSELTRDALYTSAGRNFKKDFIDPVKKFQDKDKEIVKEALAKEEKSGYFSNKKRKRHIVKNLKNLYIDPETNRRRRQDKLSKYALNGVDSEVKGKRYNPLKGTISRASSTIRKYTPSNIAKGIKDDISSYKNTITRKGRELADKYYRKPVKAVKQAVENVKKAKNAAVDGAKKTYNAAKGLASSAVESGKRAAKFVKSHGGLVGTAKHGYNKGRDLVNNTKKNIDNKVNSLKDSAKKLKEDPKKALGDALKPTLDSIKERAALGYSKGRRKLKNYLRDTITDISEKVLKWIKKHKNKILFVMKVTPIAVALVLVASIFLSIIPPLTLIGRSTPHYYCDTQEVPLAIKKRADYIRYCNLGMSNDGIVDAALSLIDPDWMWPNTSIINNQAHYEGIEDYVKVMDALQDIVVYSPGDKKLPYANCIGFATTVMAYAGVAVDDIPHGDASSADEFFASNGNWVEVNFTGDYTQLEPGTFLVGNAGQGHIFVYIGDEAMQERYPQVPNGFYLAEAVRSSSGRTCYGGVASNRGDEWIRIEKEITAWQYVGELNPRDVQ